MTTESTTLGKNPLEEMEQPSQSTKRVQNAVLGYNLKNDKMILVHFKGKPFNITIIQVYDPTTNAGKDEVEWLYEDLQNQNKPTPRKDVTFIIGDWNARVGSQQKPRVTASLALEYTMKQGKG